MPEKIPQFKRIIAKFFRKFDMRIVLLSTVMIVLACILIYRLFDLQIINGQEYLDSFQLRIKREIDVPATRGSIYDRNGNILAYNEAAYSVVIRDTYENKNKDKKINSTISKVIDIVKDNGGSIDTSFNIEVNTDGEYVFTVEGTSLLRFLADIYGYASVKDLKYEEQTKSAPAVIEDLCERFGITDTEDTVKTLELCAIRYAISLNSYQRYLPTTIASDVNDKTVAIIEENSESLEGVDIEESTVRRYVDSTYFSHILGYTGKISTEELDEAKNNNEDYDSSSIVGKAGIEKSMDKELQGSKGKQTIYVDNLGNIIETSDTKDSIAGNDIYLSIDKDLQEVATDILEMHLSQIILERLRNVKEYIADEDASSSDIIIPIYDVYFTVFNNNIVDFSHLSSDDATEKEKEVLNKFNSYRDETMDKLVNELYNSKTPYDQLTKEMKIYESYIIQYLYDEGIIDSDKIDKESKTYIDWTISETISMTDFIQYCIAQNWVNVSKLNIHSEYTDSSSIFDAITEYLQNQLVKDRGFQKKILKYMLLNDVIDGKDVCQLLLDQNIIILSTSEQDQWDSGLEDAYTFMHNRIENLDLTPAELALDPHSGSMVITDTSSGEVLAMVSYPSYDNNKLSGTVDSEYYASLQEDQSSPLLNYATQQRTAPGSTFKMVSATAGLCEGVIDLSTEIDCTGIFDKIGVPYPKCWIYPGGHGLLNVSEAITNSCNDFFYEVGYRLSDEDGLFNSSKGVEELSEYATLYGLDSKSGVEIEEYAPQISDEDAVRSAIGQGDSGYTTAELARYVTAVAKSGTVYSLTLIDKILDSSGTVILQQEPEITGEVSMNSSYWDAIHSGMKGVVEDKEYFEDLGVNVAGKTGTAQESTQRFNHALFVCYAPYENPRISVATRIANGYSSDYAAQTTKDVLSYYFGVKTKNEILTNNEIISAQSGGD